MHYELCVMGWAYTAQAQAQQSRYHDDNDKAGPGQTILPRDNDGWNENQRPGEATNKTTRRITSGFVIGGHGGLGYGKIWHNCSRLLGAIVLRGLAGRNRISIDVYDDIRPEYANWDDLNISRTAGLI